MTPHEVQYPPPPNRNWGFSLIALGIVALAFLGALLLTSAWPPGV